MKILCEMFISGLFKLSSGHMAIVGKISPDIESFIPDNSKAELYVSGERIKTINIMGEDRFSGVDQVKRQGQRSVRTDTEIPEKLDASKAKLIIFE